VLAEPGPTLQDLVMVQEAAPLVISDRFPINDLYVLDA
jgi:hypothetical protein